MEWGAVITAVAGLLLYILKQYAAAKPVRDKERADDATQQGRADIADGDAAAVNDRIDQLLSRPDRVAGQSSGPVTAGRLSAILRVATRQRGTGEDS
jgi:hypothetical protein